MNKATFKAYWQEIGAHVKHPKTAIAFFSAFFGFLVSQGLDSYRSRIDEYDKRVADQVVAFIETTREFDALVPALAHSVMDKNSADNEARSKLITNLNKQYSEIQELSPIIKSNRVLVSAYQDDLLSLNRELKNVNSVGEMRSFWEAVGNVLNARKDLAGELRKNAKIALE